MNISIGQNCLNKKYPFEYIVPPPPHKWGRNNKWEESYLKRVVIKRIGKTYLYFCSFISKAPVLVLSSKYSNIWLKWNLLRTYFIRTFDLIILLKVIWVIRWHLSKEELEKTWKMRLKVKHKKLRKIAAFYKRVKRKAIECFFLLFWALNF